MASKFAITAELNLQTKNLSQVVNNLKRQFQGIDLNIKIKDLASAESQVRGIGTAADGARKSIGLLGNSINEGVKKFAIVTIATGTFVGLTRAVKNAVGSAIEFEREMVKIAQATGKTVSQLRGLELEVGNIATGMGASSKELINAARTLTQAGFAADKVTGSLKILAQTDLAATFKSIEDTTEGAIAILNQFGREAQNTGNEVAFLERSLSAINQVSKDFAVESSDLITAVKTTGSAFESAGGSLNELIALFTSVRSTTRESAESIATGFRTIFTRVQRVDTMNNLRDLGIELQDIKGQFVGPMEAAKRLSIALSSIDPKDFRFNLIVEQLGGFRQVSKVIPLIQQFTVAQKALGVAQNSSGSLAKDAATAQQALSVQIQKTREEFLRFVKDLTQSTSFQSTVSSLLQMANAFIKVADTLKPLIPLIASFAALKIGTALLPTLGLVGGGRQKKSQGGPIGFASGGMVPGSGNGDTVPAMLTPGEFVIRKSSVKKLGANNLARANKYAGGGPVEISETSSSRPYIETKNTTHEKDGKEPITPALRDKTTPLRFNPEDQVEINLQRKEISPSKIAENNKGNAAVQAAYDKYTETVTNKDYTNRGFAFENVLVAAGELTKDAKPNSRIDGFLKNKELVEIKSTKDAKKYSEIVDDAIGGAINNQGETERVLNQRASHPSLTDDKDYIDLGNVTLLQDSDVAGFKESLAKRNKIDSANDAKAIKKAAQGGLIQKFALGGPAGKSRAARAITIPRIDSYTFDKPAGADLDSVNAKKQQYKLNAEDRLDYDVNNVNVDVSKLKVSEGLLEQYNTADDQKRGYRFEDILKETGMAKSLSQVSNARLDGITAAGDPFEAKSRKSAIGISELEDKLYGAISDNISDPEKLARARFNANDLTEKEDHIKIGKVTVFEDVTRGLGAAVNSKARTGYAEEEAAKQAKEQNKMASVNAQQKLQDLVKNNFGSGFIIQGKQYSPVTKSDKVHPDVPMNLNQLLGGKYQDTIGLNGGPAKVLELLKTFIVRNPVQNKASGGSIASLAWFASGGAASGTDTVPAMLTPGEYVINKKSAQAIGYGKLNRMNKVGKFANGGQVQYLSRGGEAGTKGIPNAPLVDDILQATGAILPNPKNAIAKIKEAGGASLDMDRTLLRTIGDLAYGKAKTPEEKLAVLKKYFFDDAARLRDVKSAKITQFGIALQEAVKNKEIDPKTLSVISKSDRTPGLPEFLQKLFGISPANMVFTGGKNKQPAVDMFREKGAFLANGGNIPGEGNQDTVPAMLTPGEYVINKKSAQAIGYGSLNRMNKVGKFASGGPVGVQRFAAGGDVAARTVQTARLNKFLSGSGASQLSAIDPKEAQKVVEVLRKIADGGRDIPKALKYVEEQIKQKGVNFKLDYKGLSQAVKAKAPQKALEPTATENAGKLKAELDGIINKGSAVSNGLVILASTVAGVVSQMSGLDKETADYVTALTGTFATINGIGQNLKNMGFAQLASMKSDREHRAAVEADKKALEQHASALSGTTSTGDEQPSKFASRLNLASKAAEGAILGYAAAQALSAAKIAATNARADKASESLGRAMEKFAASANNEAEVRNGMIKTLMLSEEAQAEYKASTSTEASVGGAAGGGIGAIIGGALGSLGGPAGTAIGVQLGATIGSFAGTFFGTELAKNFDGAKVTAAAKGISGAFTTASKGILDTNKYFEKIEGKDLNNVNQQFSKMNTELAKAQAELSSFDPSILTTGSEQMKAQFNKAAETVRNFENSIGRLAGIKLQKLTTLMSDMAKLGQNFDIGPAIKAQQDQITKVLNAKYNPDIARATKAGKGELAKGLTSQRDQEIAQGTRQFEKSLLEVRLQILETEKALIKERAARDAVIGTLVQEKALKTTLQNFKFAVQQAGKSVDQLDAAFSNSVSGLKSAIPSGDVFDLEMPDAADLEPALAALRTIGPIGEKLATNLTDLNTVIPNLETGLESLAKAQATGGASTDIDKLVRDTVEKGFGVSVGSAVGKRLSEIIKDRMTGKGGSVENANPSILSANTREAITKEFTDYAQAIKSMSKETLQVWAAAEEEQRKILDKINESENRKLELTNQGVDSYGRMVEAVSKAYGKNVPLAVKNMQRFAKQFNSIGKTAYSSIQDIGKNLKQAKGQLAQGVKDPLEAGKLQNTANRLEQSLKTLANQSDRAGDTLAELEKFKAQREAITSAGTSYAFGSDEQRKSKDDATVALQQVMAAGGDLDAVSSDMRGQIDSLLGELGDAGKNIKKQLTANFFAKRGNTDMANMVMSESSGPEQKLIAELQTIYQEEIAAQKELKDLEIMHGQGMITGLAQVTNQIAGFNDQLKARVQKGEKGAQDIQKAAGVTDSKMTVKEIDEIINSTKTSLTKVEENIATFAKYLGELNEYLAFVKDPEAFKKTGAPIPAKPGAVPVAKAKGGIIYKADGGFTPRGTDTVPAMLTPGEFVIQKSAVDSIGVGNLEAMNNGYADGGLVSYFRRGGRAMNYGRSANNKRQRAIARRDERRTKKAQEMQQQSADQSFNQASTASVQGLGADPMQALQPTGFNTNVVANPSPVSVPDLQRISDDRQKSDAQFNPFTNGTLGGTPPPADTGMAEGFANVAISLAKNTNTQEELDQKAAANLKGISVRHATQELNPNDPKYRNWGESIFGSELTGGRNLDPILDAHGLKKEDLPKEQVDKFKAGPTEGGGGIFGGAYRFLNSRGSGRYKSDKNTIYRPNGTGPGVKLNQPKKEEPAKRQISDLSKEEAAKMLGRMTGMANGGMVEYHARGGRVGARARAAQRRQNRMQSEQEFPSMAQVGPQNVHRDLAGTPVTRSVMNNPQNFAQASNARSRKAAMRGVPGYLGEMAAMGQMINVGADTEESRVRTKYSSSGANQFAEGAERQAMLKEIADARQRDKDKYSPERMRSLYGEKNTTKPTPPRVAAPVAPASTMGATAPKAKPKYDGYTNREYSKSDKPLTAVEKAMQAVRPGYRENTEPLVDYTNPYHAQVAHAKEAKAQGKPSPPTAAEIHAKSQRWLAFSEAHFPNRRGYGHSGGDFVTPKELTKTKASYKDSPDYKLLGQIMDSSAAKRAKARTRAGAEEPKNKDSLPKVAKLARGGRVGGYSGGGKIRRYQDGGNVDPYAESGGGRGDGEAPQMPDMSGFAKSIESLTAFVGSFDGFTKTMAGLASQLSSVTVTHNVTFGGQVNVGGVSGEGIVNAMKSTIEGWVKDQISKHPDVKKAIESSDQTRKG